MKRGGSLRRRTPLKNRPPTRKPHTPSRPRRRPDPDREFWRRQREALYARAGGRCERCGVDLNHTGMEAHHRKLRAQGGGHDLTNLAALCPGDHLWMHQHPAAAREAGYIVPGPADPASRPVRLHDGRIVRLTVDGAYDVCFDEKGDPTP